MKKTEIRFEIPEEILIELKMNAQEFVDYARLASALMLFKNHKLTHGRSVKLSGISYEDFLTEMSKNEIDLIAYDPSELKRELAYLNGEIEK